MCFLAFLIAESAHFELIILFDVFYLCKKKSNNSERYKVMVQELKVLLCLLIYKWYSGKIHQFENNVE